MIWSCKVLPPIRAYVFKGQLHLLARGWLDLATFPAKVVFEESGTDVAFV